MVTAVQQRTISARHRRKGRHSLAGPLAALIALTMMAAAYVTYVLWPHWPASSFANNPPSLPIVIADTTFEIEPAAVRHPLQRQVGRQERIDLAYLWPNLWPAGLDSNSPDTVLDPNARLFVTIKRGDDEKSPMQRAQAIYPRYLVAAPISDPFGLTIRHFRDGSPYDGEELVFESQAPEHFFARCSLKEPANFATCLLERRIGPAEITIRFPRAWLSDWKSVVNGVDRLLARLHP